MFIGRLFVDDVDSGTGQGDGHDSRLGRLVRIQTIGGEGRTENSTSRSSLVSCSFSNSVRTVSRYSSANSWYSESESSTMAKLPFELAGWAAVSVGVMPKRGAHIENGRIVAAEGLGRMEM